MLTGLGTGMLGAVLLARMVKKSDIVFTLLATDLALISKTRAKSRYLQAHADEKIP